MFTVRDHHYSALQVQSWEKCDVRTWVCGEKRKNSTTESEDCLNNAVRDYKAIVLPRLQVQYPRHHKTFVLISDANPFYHVFCASVMLFDFKGHASYLLLLLFLTKSCRLCEVLPRVFILAIVT